MYVCVCLCVCVCVCVCAHRIGLISNRKILPVCVCVRVCMCAQNWIDFEPKDSFCVCVCACVYMRTELDEFRTERFFLYLFFDIQTYVGA